MQFGRRANYVRSLDVKVRCGLDEVVASAASSAFIVFVCGGFSRGDFGCDANEYVCLCMVDYSWRLK